MKLLKISMLILTMLSGLFNKASANNSTQICSNNEVELTQDQISCINVSQTKHNEYTLLAFNKFGWLLEEMRMSAITMDNKNLLKFEVRPLDPSEQVQKWKIIDPATNKIIEDKLDNFANEEKYASLLIKESKIIIAKDLNRACGEAVLFCTLGAAVSVTIIMAPLAIVGCADMVRSCVKQRRLESAK